MGTAVDRADALDDFSNGQQARSFEHLALAMQPLGFTKTNLTQGQYATSANRWGVSS
jgi:hypothetical protein